MKHFFTLLLVVSLVPAKSQSLVPNEVGLSMINQTFGYASKHMFQGSLHPGVSATLYYDRAATDKASQRWSMDVGFFQHEHFQTGAFLIGGLNYNLTPSRKVKLTWGPRAGYLHTFYPDGIYRFENGEYQRRLGGRASALLGVNGSCFVPLSATIPLSLTAGLSMTVDGPFAVGFGVPVIPRVFSQIGFTYKL